MAFDPSTAERGLSTPYEDAIRAAGAGDWSTYALVKAVIATESGWNAGAINPSDPSYGLMQVTPTTARLYAPAITPDDLLDPYTNIVIGSAYLRDLLAWNALPDAIAKYNSGAARKNAQGQYINSRGDTMVQRYVESVLTYFDYYMNRLPAQEAPASEPGADGWPWQEPGAEPAGSLADVGVGAGLGVILVAAALALTS